MTDQTTYPTAEQAVIDVLTGESACTWHVGCDVEDCYGPRARAIVAELRPILAAELYEATADATEENGEMSPAGFRALALMARRSPSRINDSLSRPTAEETK